MRDVTNRVPMRLRVLATMLGLLVLGAAATPEQEGRFRQLNQEMAKLAVRNQWKGVERAWDEASTLGIPIPPDMLEMAADAARHQGDAWSAYQRLVAWLRATPENPVALGQLAIYREKYGRLTVHRIDDSPIALVSEDHPFDPDERAAIDFAATTLHDTGGFDGMLPLGVYTIGPYPATIGAGLEPVIVQRVEGDGDKKR
jgi:hypothetical protein